MSQKQDQNQSDNKSSQFKLDIDSIKEIQLDKYQPDFTFFYNNKEYHTLRFVADILSPIIRQYHDIDKTIDCFYIETHHQQIIDFSSFLSLINFEPHSISKDEIECYQDIFAQLGNTKEFLKLNSLIDQEEITKENVFQRIERKFNLNTKFNATKAKNETNIDFYENNFLKDLISNELNFISKHFTGLDHEKILKLSPSIIYEIIRNDQLKLEDEDSLIQLINKIYLKNRKYSYFYSYVNFQYVSETEFENFSNIFDVNDINNEIWQSILKLAIKSLGEKQSKNNEIKNKNESKHLLNESEFNGIIKYLTTKTGGNIHDNGTIEVTTNSLCKGQEPKYLLNFDYNGDYNASPNKKAWVCFDFKDKKIKITNYSIKSNCNGPNQFHLKSWILEVSNDGQNWTKIDERKNCQEVNGPKKTGTFSVQANDFSRYVRLNQTEPSWNNAHVWFYYMEFYGYLLE